MNQMTRILLVLVVGGVWAGFYPGAAVAEQVVVWEEDFESDPQLEDNTGWLGDDSDPTWSSDIETVVSGGKVNVRVRQSPKTGDMVYCDPAGTRLARPLTEADEFSLSFDVSNAVKEAGYARLGIGFYDSVTAEKKFQVGLGGDVNWSVNDPTDSYASYPSMVMGTDCNGYTPNSVLLEYFPSGNPGVDPGSVKLTLYDQVGLGGDVLCTGIGADITWNNKGSDGTLLAFNVDSVCFCASRYGVSASSSINSADFDNLVWKGPAEAVPEPSTIVLLVSMGLIGLACGWRRKRSG